MQPPTTPPTRTRLAGPRTRRTRPLSAFAGQHPDLEALVAWAAQRVDMTPHRWLETRLRACVLMEANQDQTDLVSLELMEELLNWTCGSIPLDHDLLPETKVLMGIAGTRPRETVRPQRSTTAPREVTHKLFERKTLKAAQASNKDPDCKPYLEALARSGNTRQVPVITAKHMRSVQDIGTRAPHLAGATEAILGALAIGRRAGTLQRTPPLLLVGPPAAGKTWWTNQIAEALGLPVTRLVMSKVTASWVLSGGSPAWSNSRPGRIVQMFLRGACAAPVLILDEIDKINPGNYDPAPVLLDLLESESACRWHDEFFGFEFDVSRMIVVATANRSDVLDPALRSRFREIRVGAPAAADLHNVICSVWAAHRALYPALRLPQELPGEAVSALTKKFMGIRALQRTFDDAIARAAVRCGRLRILPADLGLAPLRLVRN